LGRYTVGIADVLDSALENRLRFLELGV